MHRLLRFLLSRSLFVLSRCLCRCLFPVVSGYKTSAKDVESIMDGLSKNDMLGQYTHLLTGYMSSVEFLEQCVHTIQQLKKNKPDLLFGQCTHTTHFLLDLSHLPILLLLLFSCCILMNFNNQSTFVLLI